ncbi:MAG: hypothetical protein ACI4E0_06840 [Blautia sp.]
MKFSGTETDKGVQDARLWERLKEMQGELFYTSSGLEFTYRIKDGELFISRKEKSITQSTVVMAFHKALDMEGKVKGPKKLGTFGASYLYPLLLKLGVIQTETKSCII